MFFYNDFTSKYANYFLSFAKIRDAIAFVRDTIYIYSLEIFKCS